MVEPSSNEAVSLSVLRLAAFVSISEKIEL